jgi:Zn-dependent M28 family amino/carboxypeptidase
VPRRRTITWLATLLLALGMLSAAPAALAAPGDSQHLREAVSLKQIRRHQQEFQNIANANGGTRASGTPGYDRSVDYVVRKLRGSGYSPTVFPFDFAFFRELAPAVLAQTAPIPTTYQTGTFTYSGSGDVTAAVTPIDVVVPIGANPDNTSTSGCEAADFTGFTAGNVALVQRGTCPFQVKALNAEAAGASAVVVFNEGQPGRTALIVGTLGAPGVDVPVVGLSYADGEAIVLQSLGGATVNLHVATSTESEIGRTVNVLADTRKGDPNNVVVVGAHLDSVIAGPGINDNGSGSATILEIALQMARFNHPNRVRFAWWGAEELNLLGSAAYVNSLTNAQKDAIALNLNFDMVGSPNFVRFVYDGDNSAFPAGIGGVQTGPPGSGAIEQTFTDYFSSQGLESEPTPFNGRSDYGPFITATSPAHPNGIPAGGLFTGAEGIKTVAQAAVYGGTAGVAYDPCYHQACDTYANNSDTGLDQMSDAAAHAVITFANSTAGVRAAPAAAGATVSTLKPQGHEAARLAA